MTAKVKVLKEFDRKGIRMKFGGWERRYGKGQSERIYRKKDTTSLDFT